MIGKNHVGVDIGSGFIKLSHQHKGDQIPTPENCMENGVIKDIPKLAQVFNTYITSNKLKGKKAVISYNGPSIFTKILKIPKMDSNEIENYLNLEGENIVPFPLQEGVMDYIELSSQSDNMEIIIIALRNELVIPYIQVVKQGGLTPIAVDIPALAIARMFFKEKKQGLQLVLDMGKKSTDIHIYKNSIFSFSRTINIGGDDFDNALSLALGIEESEAFNKRMTNSYEQMVFSTLFSDLQRELRRSIDYFRYRFGNQDSETFTKAYIIGGNSNLKGLKHVLDETLEINAQIMEQNTMILAQGLEMWRDKA